MKFTSTIISFAALFSVASAVNVRYDTAYDNAQGSLSTVACSDGSNGLLTKNFTTFGSLPSFPNIGAAQAVGGWNSPACGSCWTISFGGKSINVIAVDHAGDGFNLSLEAMNTLTNGHAQELGVINAQATQVDPSQCGL
ncbi:Cerato-platanin [Lactarius akahatsu]|uniref:Cerato-platanin n=1 Tax=Lactarius akahatsu TaxID=416441 RepID=A0AAD4QAT9_9AGAM|nr:Cerato-platanin [Lactarius akahatsu]